MSLEIWKDIAGYEGLYAVSNLGRVQSFTKTVRFGDHFRSIAGRMMRLRREPRGYFTIKISRDCTSELRMVHQLVLEAFVGPCPEGQQCRHLDGNPANNRLGNLTWGTAKENSDDKVVHGTQIMGESQGNAKLRDADIPEIHRLYEAGKTFDELAEVFGVSDAAIGYAVRGHTFRHCQPATTAKIRPAGFQAGNRAKGKLSDESRRLIRIAFDGGESYSSIAGRFGVSYPTVWSFINGKSYR